MPTTLLCYSKGLRCFSDGSSISTFQNEVLPILQPVVYMLAHASLCLLASISATLWWRSFWAHSAFIMVMLLGATWCAPSPTQLC